ncbi:glycoside hydrolase family protein [Spirosoma panaciterrae]|uniref:glycoside hydrolase family protein n=1 Tax=Spirosoma panaciterrae TaxID=496058 RepID=UPI000361844F|nr:glycoside hydrolase family protein [Spirosoma panaciterrae]
MKHIQRAFILLWALLLVMPGCRTSTTHQRKKTTDLNIQTMLQPVPTTAVMSDSAYFIWCGTMVRGKDGTCHLYYSRWRRELGFNAWVTHSEVAHATARDPLGPYVFQDVALPARGAQFWDGLCTHNPTVHEFNGKYYLYYMGNTGDGKNMKTLNFVHRNNQRIGVAVADNPGGPWKRTNTPLIDVSPDSTAPDALLTSNPSITQRPDGGFLMVYKAVGKKRPGVFGGPVVHMVATADSPTGPFTKYPQTVFNAKGTDFPAEDPFIWYQGDRYWAIVKDMHGAFTSAGRSLVLFDSRDGFDWNLAKHPLVSTLQIRWADGRVQPVGYLERPQLWFDKGKPAVLLLATTVDQTQSYNVQVPLR